MTIYQPNAQTFIGAIPNPINIASSSDTNPIYVITSTPHNLLTDAFVEIAGHAVNTNINGQWQIVVDTATQFHTRTVTIGNGAGNGGATGTVQSLSLGSFALYDDSSPPNAAALMTPVEENADQAAFLATATGKYKLIASDRATRGTAGSTAWSSVVTSAVSAWVTLGSILVPVNLLGSDFLKVTFHGSGMTSFLGGTSQTVFASFGLGWATTVPGGVLSTPFFFLPGSSQTVAIPCGVSLTTVVPICLGAKFPATSFSSGNAGQVTIAIMGNTYGFSPDGTHFESLAAVGEGILDYEVWRPTGMPQ